MYQKEKLSIPNGTRILIAKLELSHENPKWKPRKSPFSLFFKVPISRGNFAHFVFKICPEMLEIIV